MSTLRWIRRSATCGNLKSSCADIKKGPGRAPLFVRFARKAWLVPTDDRNQPAANSQANVFSIAIGHIGVARLRAADSMSGSI